MSINALQWIILIAFGVVFFFVAPLAKNTAQFFKAKSKEGKEPGIFLLTSSLVIAWIFAKSIANAANLGLAYGFIGGLAYACYYLSFLVGGVVIYYMRKKGHFESIHHFLRSKYGSAAVKVFSIVIGFRLFNEVWSEYYRDRQLLRRAGLIKFLLGGYRIYGAHFGLYAQGRHAHIAHHRFNTDDLFCGAAFYFIGIHSTKE